MVFAHRWTDAKHPTKYLQLAAAYRQQHPQSDIRFVVLHPVPITLTDEQRQLASNGRVSLIHCKTRAEYWEHMQRAAVTVSTAQLETFGYAVLEGVVHGAKPFVPSLACYPHMYTSSYLYDSESPIEHVAKSLHAVLERPILDLNALHQDCLTSWMQGQLKQPAEQLMLKELLARYEAWKS